MCVCVGGGTAKLWNSGRNRRAVWSTLVAMEMLGIAFGPKATLMTSKNLCLCVCEDPQDRPMPASYPK